MKTMVELEKTIESLSRNTKKKFIVSNSEGLVILREIISLRGFVRIAGEVYEDPKFTKMKKHLGKMMKNK